jgi:hypothetical protein
MAQGRSGSAREARRGEARRGGAGRGGVRRGEARRHTPVSHAAQRRPARFLREQGVCCEHTSAEPHAAISCTQHYQSLKSTISSLIYFRRQHTTSAASTLPLGQRSLSSARLLRPIVHSQWSCSRGCRCALPHAHACALAAYGCVCTGEAAGEGWRSVSTTSLLEVRRAPSRAPFIHWDISGNATKDEYRRRTRSVLEGSVVEQRSTSTRRVPDGY